MKLRSISSLLLGVWFGGTLSAYFVYDASDRGMLILLALGIFILGLHVSAVSEGGP